MAYNLTQNQKDIAIWLVRKVKGGELQEEIEIRWNGYEAHEGEVIFPFERRLDNYVPRISGGVLDALEKEEFISSQKYFTPATKGGAKAGGPYMYSIPKHENKRVIILRGKIYEAVDSEFGEKTYASSKGLVFINYRRADSEGYAGRIYDHLAGKYGRESIYMDVDNIPKGVDFDRELDPALNSCISFISVIGQNWLWVKDEKGNRRLDVPEDLVRREIHRALEREIRFFPLLVGGAQMPKKEDLPTEIQQMVKKNAIVIRHDSWGSDIYKLTFELDSILSVRNKIENALELRIFNASTEPGQELCIIETNDSNHVFGLELRSLHDNIVTGIIIDLQISWEGNTTEDSRVFETPPDHLGYGWVTQNGGLRMHAPAHLSLNEPDNVVAFNHSIKWDNFRLRVSKPQRLKGQFQLNYIVTSISPYTVTKGALIIKMNE
ncbi:MAG TPA: toll/interleukin-1 receptor domain-containing protein [Anaerolineales bacterium]